MTPAELILTLARLGLSQVQAAKLLGVRENTVSRWITGRRKIPGPVIAALRAWERCGVPEPQKR